MSKKLTRRTQRHRRAEKARLKHGPRAKPKHKLQSGRTGQVHHKRQPSRQHVALVFVHPSFDWGALIDQLFAVRAGDSKR